MGFLTDIVAETRHRLAEEPLDEATLVAAAATAPTARDLAEALRSSARTEGIAVIAEVKRASPSVGEIARDTDPVLQANTYDAAGAAAVSVLTEPDHFGGSLDDLRAIRAAVDRPVLRKDFLLEPSQVFEARSAGADSVLLITACLDDDTLARMLGIARGLGMEPLLETHSDRDLARALATDAEIVGVNARDLETLEVDVPAALARLARIPEDRVAVLESGISHPTHVAAAVEAGAMAILVGEALMRARDPGQKLRELLAGVPRTQSEGRRA